MYIISSDNRNVLTLGIFAHANAGKTTITEHLLFHTGVIEQVGRVDTGNTVTDSLSVEKARGITVRDSLVSFNIGDKTIQLIDTPGHIDFSAEVERAISVLDGAVLVISGVEGLEAQTYTIWRALIKKNIPVIIFINKMDRRGADFKRVLSELQKNLNVPSITLNYVYQKNDGNVEIKNSTVDMIIEELSLVDNEVLNSYVNNQSLSIDMLNSKIELLSKQCKIFPVIGGSALRDIGVKNLVDYIGKCIPVTDNRSNDKLTAFVYTIRVDENGKNAYAKILKGQLGIRDIVKFANDKTGKIKNMYMPVGSKLVPINFAQSGEIVVINGLDINCGEIIGDTTGIEEYISFVKPLFAMEVNPLNKKDTIELMNALKILNDEDPYLNVRYNEKTNSIYVNLMGTVQAEIVKTMLQERFSIDVKIEHPIIIHKEVPTVKASAKATYTTVSGIGIEVTPLEAGSGFIYKSKISTDFLHLKYQRQIERLINHYKNQGLYGWEITDVEVALVDGQFDSMGSDPSHFNIITPIVLFRCLKNAKIKLYEPICKFIITTPNEAQSLVIRSLSICNAFYEITKSLGEVVTIEGEAKLSLMMDYPLELSKLTAGRGTFTSELSKYALNNNEIIENNFIGADPRNEVTFIINDMKASLEPLDKTLMKKKKESRSKFARQQHEKKIKGGM